MSSITFDTLALADKLEKSGFTAEQAKAVTSVLRETREADLDSLATKQDLRELEFRLKADILKWMFGGMAAQAGIIVALLKLL